MPVWFDRCALLVVMCPDVVASLCTVASALLSFGMIYIPPFYVVRPDIFNYANSLIHPYDVMPSIYKQHMHVCLSLELTDALKLINVRKNVFYAPALWHVFSQSDHLSGL
jgi:hypothetical protein